MQMERDLYLIGYDVSSPKTLQRVLRLIKSYAVGGQKSFYECLMTDSELHSFIERMKTLLDFSTDSLLVLQLDPRSKPFTVGRRVCSSFDPFVVA